jgi:hypothetical protein
VVGRVPRGWRGVNAGVPGGASAVQSGMRTRLVSALVVAAAWPSAAWPCTAPGDDQRLLYAGARFAGVPLLLGRDGSGRPLPSFRVVGGRALPLELDVTLGARFRASPYDPITAFTTSAALGLGEYALGDDTFTVAGDGLDTTRAPVVAGATLLLAVHGAGCGATGVRLTWPAPDQRALYVVELTRADGQRSLRTLATTEPGARLYGALDEPFCAQLHGYAWDGAAHTQVDLGCVDPADADDPRVTHAGCSALSTSSSTVGVLGVVMGVMAGVRRRRRREG